MEKQPKLTLTGLIVVIIIVTFWILIFYPALEKVKRIEQRTVCGMQLKTIGNAIAIYADDYDGLYPVLPGKGPWSKKLGFAYDMEKPDFAPNGRQNNTDRTISASLYLLVRNMDVDPNQFICPFAEQSDFKRSVPKNTDLTKLWDFGPEPNKHVSYSYHNPYGKYPADNSRSPAFAVLADMNPWFKDGNIISPGKDHLPPQTITIPPQWLDVKPWQTEDLTLRRLQYQALRQLWEPSNSLNHLPYTGPLEKKANYSEGQYVLWTDGHVSYEEQSNVGVNNDNIYTFWSTEGNPSEQDIQGGTAPTSRGPENDAKSKDDSFLAI